MDDLKEELTIHLSPDELQFVNSILRHNVHLCVYVMGWGGALGSFVMNDDHSQRT